MKMEEFILGKILVVGSINMDVVIRVPHIPIEGETLMARGIAYHGGGKGANQATAVGRLGGEADMIGRIGRDDYGKMLLQSLIDSGLSASGIEFDGQEPTGTAYINVSDRGENNIVVHPGANAKLAPEQIRRHERLFDEAKYCLIQMEIPLDTIEEAIRICRSKGVKVLLNPAPARALRAEMLRDLYIIVPNESELDTLCPAPGTIEQKAQRLYETGVRNVIVTLGSKGSMLVNGNGVQYFDAVAVQPVDTTAAGDTFIGGLAVGLSENREIESAIRFASLAAAIAVGREGAQTSIPDRRTVSAAQEQRDLAK